MWDPKKILVHTEAGRCFVFKGASLSAYKLVKRPQTMSDVTPEEIYRTLCKDADMELEADITAIDSACALAAAAAPAPVAAGVQTPAELRAAAAMARLANKDKNTTNGIKKAAKAAQAAAQAAQAAAQKK